MHWLFLRGLAREQRHWGSFPALFARRVPGARVHCLDLPGAGTERGRASPTTVEAIAADLRGALARAARRARGTSEPWGLLGMSLGGMVAMAWCAAHPEDFARLVLAGTSAGDLSRPWRRFDLRIVPTGLGVLAERDPVRREEKVLSHEHPRPRRPGRRRGGVGALPPMAPRQRGPPAPAAASFFRAPARVAVPALVIAGAPRSARRSRRARGSWRRTSARRFAIHPDAGHELALDAPDWVAGDGRRLARRPARAEPRDAARCA